MGKINSLSDSYNLDGLIKDLEIMVKTLVIKYSNIAKEYETPESKASAAKYIAAIEGTNNIYSYTEFDREVLLKAGFTDEDINNFETVFDIPKNKLPLCIKLQDMVTISEYEEQNNYYRQYIGLPNIEDEEFIFAPDVFYQENEIDFKPVHQFDGNELAILDSYGFLDMLIEDNPDKEYLKFMMHKIDLVNMRKAKNFTLLYLDSEITNDFLYEEFTKIYESTREYYMIVAYNQDISVYTPGYDNFMAMEIMIATIQRMFNSAFSFISQRNFFDLKTIKLFYDSYNCPYIEKLPFDYHRILTRNLNYLLQYKSTQKSLTDLFYLLNSERLTLYRYYLIKQQKLDENNNPHFIYKEDGTLDKRAMYNFYFQLVEMNQRNLSKAFNELSLQEKYKTITENDPYWIEDKPLQDKLLDSEFNFIETKYLGISIMYEMTEILFEIQYSLNLIIDKKAEVEKFKYEIPKLFGTAKFDLFTIVVLLEALICKKQGFKGNILYKPNQIVSIYKLNFKEEMVALRNQLLRDPMVPNEMKSLLADLVIDDEDDLNRIFENLRRFREILSNKLVYAKTIDEYYLYYNIYKATLIADENNTSFALEDGTQAKTYLEYLEEYNALLANFVKNIEKDDISDALETIIVVLQEVIMDIDSLFSLNDSNSILIEATLNLIIFLKSYTTDIATFSVNYLFSNAMENHIKYIDEIKGFDIDMMPKDYIDTRYDNLKVDVDMIPKDTLRIRDEIKVIWDD